jgi:hypothetical protein
MFHGLASKGTDYLQAEAMPDKAQWRAYFPHFQAGSSTTISSRLSCRSRHGKTRRVSIAGSGSTTGFKSVT